MMRPIKSVILISSLLWLLLSTTGIAGQEKVEEVRVVVEGVAAHRQAATVAAIREIGERLLGLYFSVLDGKYAVLDESSIPIPLDMQRKKLIGIEKMKTGLFKARIEVIASSDFLASQKKLREITVWGESVIGSDESVLLARHQAREDALKKAIITTVTELYPGKSAPYRLQGRVFFLGAIREKRQGERYNILARVKVELKTP